MEFFDPSDDALSRADYDDTRRPRLTMKHLHKLRIAKDAERMDKEDHLEFIPQMYNIPDSEGSGGL